MATGPGLKGATAVHVSGKGVTASVIAQSKAAPKAKPAAKVKYDPKAEQKEARTT